MEKTDPIYAAIDLKSFYASVECVDRGLDPLTTNLVVADINRTEKTICLAVSPSLKAYGIAGRARLFEVVQKVKEVNAERIKKAPNGIFRGSSYDDTQLKSGFQMKLDYLTAQPRMALYMEYSTRIYELYLNYIAPEDIHVYSIDEVFLDVSTYLNTYHLTAYELTKKIMQEVLQVTGITATAGIGTNLYLCKVALDIVAKHVTPDQDGMLIAQLNENSYRQLLWSHRPLTDFWRVGKGYTKKLEDTGLLTMGDVARCSIGKSNEFYNEELLYKLFGINAELLIDHAWGWEPCTIADIKAYKPSTNSIGSGQVLKCPYSFEQAKRIIREMTDLLVLDLVSKGLVTNQMVLTVGYDIENLTNPAIFQSYQGKVTIDHYGRKVPKHAHGTANLNRFTSSTQQIIDAMTELYDRIVNQKLLIRRITIAANHVTGESILEKHEAFEQLNLFTDYGIVQQQHEEEEIALKRERKIQQAMLDIQKKYGKNAILKGANLEEGATTIERNKQIGGHKA